jgi:hypothetical protein
MRVDEIAYEALLAGESVHFDPVGDVGLDVVVDND